MAADHSPNAEDSQHYLIFLIEYHYKKPIIGLYS